MKISKVITMLLLLGLTATVSCHASRVTNSLGRKTLSSASHSGRSLLDAYINAAQSAASQTFQITSEPTSLSGGECYVSGFPGNDGALVQGPLYIKVGVGSQQNITFNATDGPGAYRRLNITGNTDILAVTESDASGLSQISIAPTAAGQTTTFVAVRMITTSPPMRACQITITFTAINEIDISPALSAANPYFDIYSSQPDGRSGASGQQCYIKGYPGNTAANLPAVQGPMQINVTVGKLQYLGFKSVDSSLYYQELVANSTVDSAISVDQNSSYGLGGVTYKPTLANIGHWTTFTAAHYLNVTPPVLACAVTINFTAVPAASPNPTPNPTSQPTPYNPTPYSPTPNPTQQPSPTPKPTQTPTPTQIPTPPSPPIGTCVGPTTCTCQNGYCFNKLNETLTSICSPPGEQQCTLASVSPAQIGSQFANGYPATVDVCKCQNTPPTPPAPAPTPPPIGTCVGPNTCQCQNGYCFNVNGRDLNSICTPPGGQTCSSTNINPAVIGAQYAFGFPASVNVCQCTPSPTPSPPVPAPPTPPPIGTCVGPQTCACENGYCFFNSGSDLTSICTPPGNQQCSLVTVSPSQISSDLNGFPSSVIVCDCGSHSSNSSPPPPAPITTSTPPLQSPPPAPTTPAAIATAPPTPTATPSTPWSNPPTTG